MPKTGASDPDAPVFGWKPGVRLIHKPRAVLILRGPHPVSWLGRDLLCRVCR